jgi:hypothetical protein
MTQVQPAQPDADIVSLADERAVVDLVTSSVFKLWGAVASGR